MRLFYQSLVIMMLAVSLRADTVPTTFKPAPTRPVEGPNLIVEEQEVLETCDSEQICVQGRLFNNGSKPAASIKLRIEIGGTRQGKPRYVVSEKVDNTTMNPGDKQDFYFTLERKIVTKNSKGEEKIIEVGKYNFRVIPTWTSPKPPPKPKPTVKAKPKPKPR